MRSLVSFPHPATARTWQSKLDSWRVRCALRGVFFPLSSPLSQAFGTERSLNEMIASTAPPSPPPPSAIDVLRYPADLVLACSHAPDAAETEKMVELIQSYRELCNSIDRVADRPFDPNIDVQADDYPVGTCRVSSYKTAILFVCGWANSQGTSIISRASSFANARLFSRFPQRLGYHFQVPRETFRLRETNYKMCSTPFEGCSGLRKKIARSSLPHVFQDCPWRQEPS